MTNSKKKYLHIAFRLLIVIFYRIFSKFLGYPVPFLCVIPNAFLSDFGPIGAFPVFWENQFSLLSMQVLCVSSVQQQQK